MEDQGERKTLPLSPELALSSSQASPKNFSWAILLNRAFGSISVVRARSTKITTNGSSKGLAIMLLFLFRDDGEGSVRVAEPFWIYCH